MLARTVATKGQLESAITRAMVHFQAELTGHGPTEACTYLLDDMVIVRMKGILSPVEQRLAERDDGRRLIKKMRLVLRESCSEELERVVSDLTGCRVLSSHSDISTKSGERVEIYVLDENLERSLKRAEH